MIIALAEKDYCRLYKVQQHLMLARFYVIKAKNCVDFTTLKLKHNKGLLNTFSLLIIDLVTLKPALIVDLNTLKLNQLIALVVDLSTLKLKQLVVALSISA